ncbi:hypothetical protein ABT282_38765 [Streptomyces sp. NPDC000927]|uniref:hypothetical protein n=1 Tax=Streptomyces sp. NPDC000927 TaxID=3154371 RepID=UPI0033343ABB
MAAAEAFVGHAEGRGDLPYDVRPVLGRASAVTTPRIRAHPRPGGTDRTRAVVDAVLGGPRTGCGQEDPAAEEAADQRV